MKIRKAGNSGPVARSAIESLKGDRGSTIVLAALAMTAMLAVVALAVDVGMLFTARGEAQRAADAAALAGAGSLIVQPDDEKRARAVAIEFGNANTVREKYAEVLPGDVEIDMARSRVTVTVHRTAARNSGVATWFANIFGVSEVDIAARATAEASPAGSATCLKPFAIPDRFWDKNGNGQFDGNDEYDPEEYGYGSDWRNPGSPGYDGEGYYEDYGRQVKIKAGDLGEDYHQPSWYYPWDIPQVDGGPATGADRYRENIRTCNPSVISSGEEYDVENGVMDGPTVQGGEDLIAMDPDAYWDDSENVLVDSAWDPAWEGSPRIGIVPVFHPGRPFKPGKKPIEFTNFVAFFFERVEGKGNKQEVVGRILYPTGIAGGEPVAPNLRAVRLVE
ncbi:MAG TPA: pilus assembly protein TadG-related protein [Gemmatimonadota bacterium]|nr:pilus assembly protein TadG-related protein [Gemmatimonadota bacterium]